MGLLEERLEEVAVEEEQLRAFRGRLKEPNLARSWSHSLLATNLTTRLIKADAVETVELTVALFLQYFDYFVLLD